MDVLEEEQLFSDNPLLHTRPYRFIDRRQYLLIVYLVFISMNGRFQAWG